MPETEVTYQLLPTFPDIKLLQTNITATQRDRISVEFIPLLYIISKLTYILLSPTTNFISCINIFYMLHHVDHTQALKYTTLKPTIKYTYIFYICEIKQIVQVFIKFMKHSNIKVLYAEHMVPLLYVLLLSLTACCTMYLWAIVPSLKINRW